MTNTTSGASGAPELTFETEREFAVARDLMFQIWTECQHLQHWFGPKGYTMTQCNNELQPGGMLHYCLQGPDGREMWGRWVYQEIDPPQRLVALCSFSDAQGSLTRHPMALDWPLLMLSRFTFLQRGDKTAVRIETSAYDATAAEVQAFADGNAGMQQGWAGTFEQLEGYLAQLSNSPVSKPG